MNNCEQYHPDSKHRRLCEQGLLDATPVQPPSLARRAVNFARAIARHVRAGLPVVSEEEAKRRITICEGCTEYFDAGRRMCKHASCGCRMDEKVTWGEQVCPVGKW